MRILTLTTLFPNTIQPAFGVFVETRLRRLVATGEVEARVVAPVPWFPLAGSAFGSWGVHARVPRHEVRHGIQVLHPRYLVVPRIGWRFTPRTLFRAALRGAEAMRSSGFDFELIDAHYFFPDGVAAVRLAERLGVPVVITARGTDLNLIPDHAGPRRAIVDAGKRAQGVITVCKALADRAAELGMDPAKIHVLRNGVDLELFLPPKDRGATRERLGFDGPTLISVGHLIPRKGHDLLVRALPALPGVRAVIVGSGPEEARLRALAAEHGVADRVRFTGDVPHAELRDWYGAADALVLASSREGWANVLLEAMACGTPVVATDVWGTPEVVAAPEAGILMAERSPEGLAEAARRLLAAPPDRAATRAYAERFDWGPTTQGQLDLFRKILGARDSR